MVTLKSREEIARMRRAGRVVAELLALLGMELKPDVTPLELDAIAARYMRSAGVKPSFLGYLGRQRYGSGPHAYPAVTCISLDDEIVHGIPNGRRVRPGQIVSIDIAVICDGYHADAARTYIVGEADPESARLVETTHTALMAGIAAARPGASIVDISRAVETVGHDAGLGVVAGLVGHGIGNHMHEEPDVPNVAAHAVDLRLRPGLCLAIEPMFTLGSPAVRQRRDGWTMATKDGSRAAHFEHTIAITDDGAEILTTI